MNALRVARAAARIRPSTARLPLQRRGYADAVSDKIKLTLALPHQVGNRRTLLDLGLITVPIAFYRIPKADRFAAL